MSNQKITFVTAYKVKAEGGEEYKEGQEITCSDETAKHFISRGVAVNSADYKPAKKPEEDNPNTNDDEVSMQEIIEAISLLEEDNPDHWTADRRPQVKALEHVLGKDITAEQRDQAFEAYNQD